MYLAFLVAKLLCDSQCQPVRKNFIDFVDEEYYIFFCMVQIQYEENYILPPRLHNETDPKSFI